MITNEQANYLYQFCEKKGVRYYDLQTELVDHLCEAIGEKQASNPGLSFDEALMQVYKSFGITGFSGVIMQRETALLRTYNRMRWRYFKTFFDYPKIALTLLLLFLINAPVFVFKIRDLQGYYLAITALAGVTGLLLWIAAYISFKKPAKKLMQLKNYKVGFGIFGAALQFPNLYYFILKDWHATTSSPLAHIAITCIAVFIVLFSFAEYYAYKSTYERVKKQYPLAFKRSD